MEEQKQRVSREPESLAPIQLERVSVEDEVAQMKTGKGLRLTLTLLIGVAGVFGIMRWMGTIDHSQAYAHAADRLEEIDAQQGEAYLRCALPNLQNSQISSSTALHSAIEVVSERYDKRYAQQLAGCAYLLNALESALSTVQAPPDMTRRVEGLRLSAQNFAQAWEHYRAYLKDPAQRYDYVQATPLIEKISVAWQGYQTQRAEATAALRARE
jgi:hypothetical protein